MKYFFARHVKLLTKQELVDEHFWGKRMTSTKCTKYIEHTHVVLPKLVQQDCGITGEH